MIEKERRLINMRETLEKESARAIDLAMDVTRAELLLADQDFLVSVIEDSIRVAVTSGDGPKEEEKV